MPRQNKTQDTSGIKQLTFFTDEESTAEVESPPSEKTADVSYESKLKSLSENKLKSLSESKPAFTSEANSFEQINTEHSDTEIIESEILPEQSVEATELPPSKSTDFTEPEPETESDKEEAKPPKKPRSPGMLRRQSVLIHFLILVAETVSRTLRNSFFASVLTAYDKTAELFRASFIYNFFAEKPASLFKSFKKYVRRQATDSVIPKKLDAIASSLLLIKSRIYGLIFLSFAASALFVHFFINLYFTVSVFSVHTPFIAVAVIIGSLFLVFSGKTLSKTLLESKIFSAFGFRLLGLNKNALNDRDCIELSASGAIILGLLLGFLTIIFPLQSILLFVLSVIYAIIVVKSPETGLISLFLIAPFASLNALVGAISVISVSYIFKVLCGKRTLSLEFPDIFVGIFLLLIAFGGTVTFGEKGNVLMYLLFIGIYFLSASILRSSIWFKRCVNAVILVGAVVSVYAVIARFLGEKLGFNLDLTLETDVGDATASIFSSFSVLSYFVLVLGIFLFSSFLVSSRKATRFGLLIANICAFIYMFITLPSGAWLAAVVAYIIILLLWKSRSAVYMIIIALFLPFLPVLKIYSVENFFHNFISVTARHDLWNAVMRMLADFGIGGIGLGENAFSSVYSAYFIGNTENAVHAGSLILQILISLGIFGLIIFAAIIFFVLQSSLSYGRNCSDKSDYGRIMGYTGMCGIIASFLWGINEFIWYNPRVMLLFWLIMGVTVSARRSSLDLETDNKETNLYGDTYLD